MPDTPGRPLHMDRCRYRRKDRIVKASTREQRVAHSESWGCDWLEELRVVYARTAE